MAATYFDLPVIVVEDIFSFCSGKDLLNIATCSKHCYESVRQVMWSTMNIQWALLNDITSIQERGKFFGLTKTLKMYNGFISDMGNTAGVGKDAVAGYHSILNGCDATKLRTLHFKYYICPGGLEITGRLLTELEHLSIHNVWLPQEEWAAINSFSKLRTFSIYNSNIDDTVWQQVRRLTDLRTLEIRECATVNCNSAYHCASNLAALEEFTFDIFDAGDDADLDMLRLSSIFKQSNLKKLQLTHENLKDEVFFGISDGLNNLTALDVNWSTENFTDVMLEHVAKLKNLKELFFQANMVTDFGISYLAASETLTKLVINCCDLITDKGLMHISRMVSLEELSVGGMGASSISDEGLKMLSASKTLSKLDFSGSRLVSDEGLEYLSNLPGQVDVICFIKCDRITDEGVHRLIKLHLLVALHLAECDRITDKGMEYISSLRHLRELYVGSTSITNYGLSSISYLSLRTLDLSMCQYISDGGMDHISRMKSLAALNLFGCKEITDVGLHYLNELKFLRRLQLSFCTQITNEGIEHLRSLPSLNWLGVEECYNVSDDLLFSLSKSQTVVRKLNHPGLAMYYAFDGFDYLFE